ncbi:MAG: trigger factor [Actinomycetes bacterium]|nr:trigger factor [Actinomycetes bacterium]MDX5380841.1 trigger factor [Actinomycetes bacterium]MDX5399904.1 trigger factor [Actinomycetes bacterium]MDX5450589.1 trigger factor [Actinomycetes bacterium]
MKSAVETLDPTRVKVTVEVPFEELKPAVDAAYREIASQVNVPGFRRGKVPARIIDQRVGRGAVIEQAVNSVLPGLYRDALIANEIKALGNPDIDVSEVPAVTGPLGGQLVFAAEVDVQPEIAIPDLSGVVLEVADADVSDDDVEERLTSLRERFGTLTGVTRAAQEDDFVVVDLRATVDGEEVEAVSGISYQVGAGNMIDGLDEALTGMTAGEEKVFTTRLVAGEHADKDSEVTVTLTEVKVRELPEADDDFAQLASEFDTIDELREDLRNQVVSDKTANQAVEAREALLVHLRQNTDFPLPQRILASEIEAHLEREGKPADDPHGEEIREETEQALRDQLLLDVLAQHFDVQVEQDELLQYLFTTAQRYGMDPTEFITQADSSGQIPLFVAELARNKSLAVALRRVTVQDASGNAVDLTAFIGQDAAPAETVEVSEDRAPAPVVEEPAVDNEPVEEPTGPAASKAPARKRKKDEKSE